MATYVDIRRVLEGVAGLTIGATNTSDGAIANGNHGFLVIAWYSKEETDINFAQALNSPPPSGSVSATTYNAFIAVTTAGADDTITLTWTPPKRIPNHYSFYYANALTMTRGTTVMQKVLPIPTDRVYGNVPGWATRAVFKDVTAQSAVGGISSEVRVVQVDSVDTVNDTYTIRGDYRLALYEGAVFNQNDGGGNQTVDTGGATLTWGANGVQTVIPITGTVNASATRLAITVSRIVYPANYLTTVQLNPLNEWSMVPREQNLMDIHGRLARKSFFTDCPYEGSSFALSKANGALVTHGQTLGMAAANYQLHLWASHSIPVEAVCTADAGVVHAYRLFRGMLAAPNDTGLAGQHGVEDLRFSMTFDEYRDSNNGFVWYDIQGSDDSPDSFTILGDYTDVFYEGRRFFVSDSASGDNDGLFVVQSVAYTAFDAGTGSDITVITPTTPVTTGGSATGRIQLWD